MLAFCVLLPLLRRVVPLYENCRLILPVVKGRCARDALPRTFGIGVKKICKRILPQKHIYNEFANLSNRCKDAFDFDFLSYSYSGAILRREMHRGPRYGPIWICRLI